jgi:hypothetical protein
MWITITSAVQALNLVGNVFEESSAIFATKELAYWGMTQYF